MAKETKYGIRSDGTPKGRGFLGELKRPDGKFSTEISIGVNFDGKEREIPSLVPTLDKSEIKHLLSGKKPTDQIVKKAVDHARSRIGENLSPFYVDDEDSKKSSNSPNTTTKIMSAPKYFQTEDEKQMAAIRQGTAGRFPRETQMVRPMLPAGSDSREKWRKPMNLNAAKPNYDPLLMTPAEIDEKDYNKREQENYRIEQQYGSDRGQARYLSQIREAKGSSFTPDQAKMSGILTPHNAPGSYSGEEAQSNAPQWQQNLTKQYPGLGIEGSSANDKFKSEFTPSMSKAEVDALAERSMGDYSSSPQPETTSLQPLIAKTDPYGTMLNDRPGGGRTYGSFSRPMGSGTLSQGPTSTAPGASERVAARRAIRMNPKSTEVAQRFARAIGGARNNNSWAP